MFGFVGTAVFGWLVARTEDITTLAKVAYVFTAFSGIGMMEVGVKCWHDGSRCEVLA